MESTGNSIIEAFDYVMGRLTERLNGLTDDEYFWEPVSGCWSLRQDADGSWRLDGDGGGPPPPDPVPFTTVAWRLGHIAVLVLGGFAESAFGEGPHPGGSGQVPPTADGAQGLLAANYKAWREGMESLDDAGWHRQLGPKFGPYSESSMLDLALHVFDELVHHAAEVGVLRDLYTQRSELEPRT